MNKNSETYCWSGSAVFARPCLRYLISVGLTGATLGTSLASLSILKDNHFEF